MEIYVWQRKKEEEKLLMKMKFDYEIDLKCSITCHKNQLFV